MEKIGAWSEIHLATLGRRTNSQQQFQKPISHIDYYFANKLKSNATSFANEIQLQKQNISKHTWKKWFQEYKNKVQICFT